MGRPHSLRQAGSQSTGYGGITNGCQHGEGHEPRELLERADRLVASNDAINNNGELLYGALINIYNEQ